MKRRRPIVRLEPAAIETTYTDPLDGGLLLRSRVIYCARMSAESRYTAQIRVAREMLPKICPWLQGREPDVLVRIIRK